MKGIMSAGVELYTTKIVRGLAHLEDLEKVTTWDDIRKRRIGRISDTIIL
jgi:hypothetical protein